MIVTLSGFVDILELGGVTAYRKTVTSDEEFLPAVEVYRDLYTPGNPAGAALLLQVLQAHLHPVQLVVLYCLKIKLGVPYRELIDWLSEMPRIVGPQLTERNTVISVLKRKYGDAVSSRVWWRQFRELVAMCLVYFAERRRRTHEVGEPTTWSGR